jgi:hypothetical protein
MIFEGWGFTKWGVFYKQMYQWNGGDDAGCWVNYYFIGFIILWYIIIDFGSMMLIQWIVKPPDYDKKSKSNFKSDRSTYIIKSPDEEEMSNYNTTNDKHTFNTINREEEESENDED